MQGVAACTVWGPTCDGIDCVIADAHLPELEAKKKERKTDNPREGWEDGTPPPHRDFKERVVGFQMGRHRSTLRDLGWSAGNSPNPWKHGSAKRVVRALDYGSIEVDAYAHSAPDDARGRLLDRIFEQESDGAGRQPPPLEREGQRGSVSQQQLLDSQLRDGMRGEQGHLRLQAAVQRTKLADPATRATAAEARLGAA
ncbi:hypothetical protein EMIHUDRAFT_254110, partial [Emiliania huxleyi CCMP1516]|uniref:Orn/DAP/Arg decarboxylase 2 C-terminal domain-containing protein n=2 Tax=Emiliania huxleyi TaxID=2903 RepID=A0A0D3JXL5_EMIH1